MKVVVDMTECIGSGMCTTIAPTVFELDDEGNLRLLKQEIAEDEISSVGDAVACCPMDALALAD
jgi:ferredoxin